MWVDLLDGSRPPFAEDMVNFVDGGETWRIPRPKVPENKMRCDIRITDMCTLVYYEGILYFAQLNPDRAIDWLEIRGRLHAFSATTGAYTYRHEKEDCSATQASDDGAWGLSIFLF